MILIIQIDESQISEVIRKSVREEMATINQVPAQQKAKTLYSIKELAEFLNVSIPTAQRYKNEDIIPYIQCRRKCMFNTNDVMSAIKKYSNK